MKDTEISNFMEIRPVVAELFHADGRQAVMMRLLVAFGNFVNSPETQFTVTSKYRTSRVTAQLDDICSITQIFHFGIFHDQEYLLLNNK